MTAISRLLRASGLRCPSVNILMFALYALLPMSLWGTLPCAGDAVSQGGTFYRGILQLPRAVADCVNPVGRCFTLSANLLYSHRATLGAPLPNV